MTVAQLVLAGALFLAGCDNSTSIYTLYRNSATSVDLRIYVASFDSTDGEDYNRGNCFIARDLFAMQPGVTVTYWCERGRYQR